MSGEEHRCFKEGKYQEEKACHKRQQQQIVVVIIITIIVHKKGKLWEIGQI